MVDRLTPDNGQSAGIPSQYSESWGNPTNHLLTGHEPGVLTDDVRFPAGIDWPALTPFAFEADGITAKPLAAGSPLVGISVKPMKTGASAAFGAAYIAGCFNPDLLAWPAGTDFDTYAERRAAPRGAPTPSNIVIRKVTQHSERSADYYAP